ncbi:hypothetical protein V2J09_022524 [Rumex salicifolius]
MAIPFGCLLFFLFLLSPSSAEIRSRSIHSNDRLIVPLDVFGFTDCGRLELNVSSFSLSNPSADLSRIGFFLTTRRSWLIVVGQIENSDIDCPLDSNLLRAVFSFASIRELNPNNTDDSSFSGYSDVDDGRYHVAFANCLPGVRVSMNVQSQLFNLNAKTGHRDYLPAGTTEFPMVYSGFSLLYFGISFTWLFLICMNRRMPSPMHILLLSFLLFKAMNLLSDAENKSRLNSTGLAHLHECLFLRLFPLLMLPHVAVLTISQMEIDQSGPKMLIPWEAQFLLLDGIVFSAVLLGLKWWIKSRKEAANRDTEEARKLKELESFRDYCAMVFSYVYLTTAVVYTLEVLTAYRYMWTSLTAVELITLGFYVSLGRRACRYFSLGMKCKGIIDKFTRFQSPLKMKAEVEGVNTLNAFTFHNPLASQKSEPLSSSVDSYFGLHGPHLC